MLKTTGKFISKAFILAATNPKYYKRLFINLPKQYMKTTSLNMLCTQIVFCLFLYSHSEQFMNTACSKLVVFMYCFGKSMNNLVFYMYWTCNSMNNLLSYCGLVDARISASEIYLPVWDIWTKFFSFGRSETLTFNAGTLGGKVATAVTTILKLITNLFRNMFQFSYPLGIAMQKYIFLWTFLVQICLTPTIPLIQL